MRLIGPNTTAPFRVFTPGACFGVALWIGASLRFALYVANFGKYDKSFGTLAGVVVFLVWLWLSNLALLVGAELNYVLEARKQGRREESPRKPAPRGVDTTRPQPA